MMSTFQESMFTRATILENWWCRQTAASSSSTSGAASDEPEKVSEETEVETFSPVRGDESPHHLRAKEAYLKGLEEPPVTRVTPLTETSADASSSKPPFDVRQFLDDEDKEIQEIIAGSVPLFSEKQRRFKFGGCPCHHALSLQPHVPKSGPQRGELLLRCSNFWKRGEDDKPMCWFQYPFPKKLWSHLSRTIQEQYVDLKNSLQRNAVKR